jgi:hypothetical protein
VPKSWKRENFGIDPHRLRNLNVTTRNKTI